MDEKTREEILELVRQSRPRQISTVIQTVEGRRASEDGVGYMKEQMAFMEDNSTPREVTLYTMRTCDCGKLVSQKNPLVGTCQRQGCARFTCSECTHTCVRCHRTYCPDHAMYAGGEIYCRRCIPSQLLKMFFGIGNKGKDE